MKSSRHLRRGGKKGVLVLEMTVDELHEIEAHARHAGLSIATYCARTLLAGDRECDHGISVLAVGATACARCWLDKREVAKTMVRAHA